MSTLSSLRKGPIGTANATVRWKGGEAKGGPYWTSRVQISFELRPLGAFLLIPVATTSPQERLGHLMSTCLSTPSWYVKISRAELQLGHLTGTSCFILDEAETDPAQEGLLIARRVRACHA